MSIFENTGMYIRKLREDLGLKQEELAKDFRVSKSTICQWENGGGIKTEMLYSISKMFHVSVEEILAGKTSGESIEVFFNRKYSLERLYFEESIRVRDGDKIEEFLSKLENIRTKYFDLLYLFCSNKIKEPELEELLYLQSYFIRTNYKMESLKHKQWLSNEFDMLSKIRKTLSEEVGVQNKQATIWELEKLFCFSRDKLSNVSHFTCEKLTMFDLCSEWGVKWLDLFLEWGDEWLTLFLKAFSCINRDKFFTDIVNKVDFKMNSSNELLCDYITGGATVLEILRGFIKAGAKVLYKRNFDCDLSIEEDDYICVTGKITECKRHNEAIKMLQTKSISYDNCGYCLSYDEYQMMIDTTKMEEIKNLIDNRETNPLLYLQKYTEIHDRMN